MLGWEQWADLPEGTSPEKAKQKVLFLFLFFFFSFFLFLFLFSFSFFAKKGRFCKPPEKAQTKEKEREIKTNKTNQELRSRKCQNPHPRRYRPCRCVQLYTDEHLLHHSSSSNASRVGRETALTLPKNPAAMPSSCVTAEVQGAGAGAESTESSTARPRNIIISLSALGLPRSALIAYRFRYINPTPGSRTAKEELECRRSGVHSATPTALPWVCYRNRLVRFSSLHPVPWMTETQKFMTTKN